MAKLRTDLNIVTLELQYAIITTINHLKDCHGYTPNLHLRAMYLRWNLGESLSLSLSLSLPPPLSLSLSLKQYEFTCDTYTHTHPTARNYSEGAAKADEFEQNVRAS